MRLRIESYIPGRNTRYTLMKMSLVCAMLLVVLAPSASAASVFSARLDDPKAVYLTAQEFGAHADGTADDSAAIQAAVDKAEGATHEGIVFVPSGRYRLTRTVYVWPGVRVIGYGATRPVFVLADNTPGFQKGVGVMVMFTGARRGRPTAWAAAFRFHRRDSVPPNNAIADANSQHILFGHEQHRFRDWRRQSGSHRDPLPCGPARLSQPHGLPYRLRALPHCTEIGNEAEDLHFYGGRYGILTDKTSPAWQFTLIDSRFEGQRDAAIREHEAASL